jgi:hypothetical protein
MSEASSGADWPALYIVSSIYMRSTSAFERAM